MRGVFEHLLGLTAESALALLAACGITDVDVTPTAAPTRAGAPRDDATTSLRVVAVQEDGHRLIVSRFRTGDPAAPSAAPSATPSATPSAAPSAAPSATPSAAPSDSSDERNAHA